MPLLFMLLSMISLGPLEGLRRNRNDYIFHHCSLTKDPIIRGLRRLRYIFLAVSQAIT
jgi:hypothetical protein